MGMETVLGILLVVVGGLIMGAGAWPMKLMRTFQFEHWWLLSIFFGLVLGPWAVTLIVFPHIFDILRDPVVQKALITANILALCWGVANILCGLCYVRIGIALTQAILSGLGVSLVVTAPMVFKGSGQFKDAPDLTSRPGLMVLTGVGVMLIGVVFASLAGFGRDKQLDKVQKTSGSFLVGLIMTVIAGITSAGLWLAFGYCQGPIQSRISTVESDTKINVGVAADKRLCEKFQVARDDKIVVRNGASAEAVKMSEKEKEEASAKIAGALSGRYLVAADGSISLKDAEKDGAAIKGLEPVKVAGTNAKEAAEKLAAALGVPEESETEAKVTLTTPELLTILPVWATGAFSGAMLNLIYPIFLITKRKTWGVLLTNWKEVGFTAIMGIQTLLALTLPGKGAVMLGALGASVGFGIQQAMQMVGGQGTGFISGEWRGVEGKPRLQMYGSIALLIVASFIMAYSKTIKE
jgi:hypothetical protein